jgi:hypothetical protein
MLSRYIVFWKIIKSEFSDIVINAELYVDRIRLTLVDGPWIEIRYPVEGKFSFHLQKGSKIYRIDTAPHHREIKTFPRHIHLGSEDNVVEDYVLDEKAQPEENLRKFMRWVREIMRENH